MVNKPSSLIPLRSTVWSRPLPALVVSPALAPVSQCLFCLETPKLDIARLLMQSQVGQIEGNEHFPGAAGYVVALVAQDVSDPFAARTHCWLMFNLLSTKNPQSLLPNCFPPGWPSTCAVAWCQSVWSKAGEIQCKSFQQWLIQYFLFYFPWHLQFEKLKQVHQLPYHSSLSFQIFFSQLHYKKSKPIHCLFFLKP